MPVYEASFLGEPTPIKKPRGKKGKKVELESALTPPPEAVLAEPVAEKPKRKRKAKEVAQEDVVIEAVRPIKKKRVPKPKPQPSGQSLAEALEEKPLATPDQLVTAALKKGRAPRIKKIVDGEPVEKGMPIWFKNYTIELAKKENSEKVKSERKLTVDVVKDAKVAAEESFGNPDSKAKIDRIDNSLAKLYKQIYGRVY